MGTITFDDGVNTVEVDYPLYGYRTDIYMSIASSKHRDGNYSFFDRGSDYDYRVSKFTFKMNSSDSASFEDFWSDPDKGRVAEVSFDLGVTPTGFFPFGPDLGDMNEFTFKMLSYMSRCASSERMFYHDLELVLISAPSYTLPDEIAQGSITIGSVGGLLMCQEDYNVDDSYNYVKSVNNGGILKQVDGPNVSDSFESQYIQQCNQSKAAALVDFLVTNRDTEITIVDSNSYMFGVSNN